MNIFVYLVSFIVISLSVLYLRFKKLYQTWTKLDVPHLEPIFPFGNFQDIKKRIHIGHILSNLYEKLKVHGDYAGAYMFQKPIILATGPEFVKTILVRDFNSFTDRGVFFNPKHDPLSVNLFFVEGQQWKVLRQKLSPAFTSGKMKIMFHTTELVVQELLKHIDSQDLSDGDGIDVKDLMARFTTDVISSCIFGLEGNSLENPESEFRKVGQKVMKFSNTKNFLMFVALSFPNLFKQIGFRLFDKESTEFFNQMVHKTIGFRRENNFHRNDLMQILIELMRQDFESESDDGLTIDEVAANAFIFFFAGFESSSTTLTYALYSLALDQDIQDKAREECLRIFKIFDNKLTYESITEMDYIDRVISETLRIFPPIASIHRVTTKPYILPNGSEIPAGISVMVPVLGIHHDKKIYPDPEKFDPERFTDENKTKRHPYAFIPFGEGPRQCIGLRFAQMQIKIGLCMLLKNYRFKICEKTQIPLTVDETTVTYTPAGQVWLKIEKI